MKRSERIHQGIQTLLKELILPFYLIDRDMMVPDGQGGWRDENDAEHSWSLTIVAAALAPHIDPGLDVGRVCELATVHDLVEIYAGDTSVWASEKDLNAKEVVEAKALEKIRAKFSHFPWLIETLEAYERKDTDEARYVWAIDKYLALCVRFMDEGHNYHKRHMTKEKFDAGLVSHRKKAHAHSGAAEFYEIMRAEFDAHPEYFYQP